MGKFLLIGDATKLTYRNHVIFFINYFATVLNYLEGEYTIYDLLPLLIDPVSFKKRFIALFSIENKPIFMISETP